MLNWVEHEKSFITSGLGFAIRLLEKSLCQPSINGYLFRIREGWGSERIGIICSEDTIDLWAPLPLRLLGYGKPLTFFFFLSFCMFPASDEMHIRYVYFEIFCPSIQKTTISHWTRLINVHFQSQNKVSSEISQTMAILFDSSICKPWPKVIKIFHAQLNWAWNFCRSYMLKCQQLLAF